MLHCSDEPADTILVVDVRCIVARPGFDRMPGHPTFDPEVVRTDWKQPRHSDGFNALFLDGHVKWLKTTKRASDTWANRVPGMWTRVGGD